jgi:signal transduction histidine kinase
VPGDDRLVEEVVESGNDLFALERRVRRGSVALLVSLLAMAAVLSVAVSLQLKLSEAARDRHASYVLADRLRQTSDDLTRMARTFVVTGHPFYRHAFDAILATRDGRRARPAALESVHWDLILAASGVPQAEGERRPLRDLIDEAGLTQTELDLLHTAEQRSNELAALEVEAMHAVEGRFPDESGAYTVTGPPDRERAVALLHGPRYHQAKKGIMLPLNDFLLALERRTRLEVETLAVRGSIALGATVFLFLVCVCIATALLFAGRRLMWAHLGTLEQQVREKTRAADEANGALARQAKLIDARNRELEDFARVVAHDLKEPLRMVSSFLGLVVGYEHDETETEYIGYATDGARRMAERIDALLRYARADQGMSAARFSLEKAVALVRHDLSMAVDEAGGTVVVETLPETHGDRGAIEHVLQNLIANAIKFREPGRPPVVTVRAETTDEHWLVEIADNGIGFEPKHAERIFKVFGRLHAQGTHEGTGIGLAVCQRIVQRHGGRIWATSVPGEGSTFHFTIPLPHRPSSG